MSSMIPDALINVIWGLLSPSIEALPDVTVTPILDSTLLDFIKMAAWLFPWNTVVAIGTLVVSLWLLRVTIAFFRTLWDVLPFV